MTDRSQDKRLAENIRIMDDAASGKGKYFIQPGTAKEIGEDLKKLQGRIERDRQAEEEKRRSGLVTIGFDPGGESVTHEFVIQRGPDNGVTAIGHRAHVMAVSDRYLDLSDPKVWEKLFPNAEVGLFEGVKFVEEGDPYKLPNGKVIKRVRADFPVKPSAESD